MDNPLFKSEMEYTAVVWSKVQDSPYNGSWDSLNIALREMLASGWEHYAQTGDPTNGVILFFRRRKPPTDEQIASRTIEQQVGTLFQLLNAGFIGRDLYSRVMRKISRNLDIPEPTEEDYAKLHSAIMGVDKSNG